MRTKLVIAAVVTAGAVSAVGATAYTESINHAEATREVGYAATAITDADFASYPVLSYNGSFDHVVQIDAFLTGDTSAETLSVNRNGAGPVDCVTGTFASGKTPYTCTVSFALAGMTSIGYLLH